METEDQPALVRVNEYTEISHPAPRSQRLRLQGCYALPTTAQQQGSDTTLTELILSV